MNNKFGIISSVAIMMFLMASCRPLGDDLLSYGQYDSQAYADLDKSHAKTFKALWTAMNENYSVWDYEAECGLNWDDVYREYLPKFEALDDTLQHKEDPTDVELFKLYSSFLDSLHDGHLAIEIKMDYMTKPLTFVPGLVRVMRERGDEYSITKANHTEPDCYQHRNGEFHIEQFDEVDAIEFSRTFMYEQLDSIIPRCQKYLAELEPVKTNEGVAKIYNMVSDLLTSAKNARSKEYQVNYMDFSLYNSICNQYASLAPVIGWPFTPIDNSVINDDLEFITVARFKGNIMYMRLGGFGLTPHLLDSELSADTTSFYYAYQQEVRRVWHCWFDAIQQHHQAGDLGGVIIDVRNNKGGIVNDYQYVLGALLPSGGYAPCMMRFKNGSGRYDFSPLLPLVMPTYDDEHVVISQEPIVVIANVQSVSMSENTSWSVKTLPNGALIGTRTFGGLSMLNTDPARYSDTYSGGFGVRNTTAIWGYVPKYVTLYDVENNGEYKPLEGIGIAPTLEVPFDLASYQRDSTDNQLEAAIRYINRQ